MTAAVPYRAALPRTALSRTPPYQAVRDSALIAGRNLRVLRKNPGRMIYPLVQPLVLLVMFVSVFGNLAITGHAGGASGTYREFLIPGIIMENAALTAPTTGLALLRDASSGLADRFADLVHVLDHGKIIASGTPEQLKERAGGDGTSLDDAFLALTQGTAPTQDIEGAAS